MKKLFIYILPLLLLLSCSEKIDFDLNKEDNIRLVVEAFFTTEAKKHRVILTQTSSYFANQTPKAEEGAKVEITDGTKIIPFTEIEPGIYETVSIDSGIVGYTYTLNIERSNGEKYTASSTITPVTPVDSVTYDFNPAYGEKGEYVLYLWAQESPGEGDFYQWDVYLDSSLHNGSLENMVFSSDDFVDGAYIPGLELYYFAPEDLTNDTSEVKVDMLSIPRNYYEFLIAASLETVWNGGPFDGPPANIKGNLSNGALGFFLASDVSSYQFKLVK